MPAAWSPKDERQYGHILKSCVKRAMLPKARCKTLAAKVINSRRRREGRSLRGLGLSLGRFFR